MSLSHAGADGYLILSTLKETRPVRVLLAAALGLAPAHRSRHLVAASQRHLRLEIRRVPKRLPLAAVAARRLLALAQHSVLPRLPLEGQEAQPPLGAIPPTMHPLLFRPLRHQDRHRWLIRLLVK